MGLLTLLHGTDRQTNGQKETDRSIAQCALPYMGEVNSRRHHSCMKRVGVCVKRWEGLTMGGDIPRAEVRAAAFTSHAVAAASR